MLQPILRSIEKIAPKDFEVIIDKLRTAISVVILVLSGSLGLVSTVSAQTVKGLLQGEQVMTGLPSETIWAIHQSLWIGPAVGEDYIVELGAGLWSPIPRISASSEQFGITGTTIDFGPDLGMTRQIHREFKVTFKPGRRHKLRISYLSMNYQQKSVIPRQIIFQGIRYNEGQAVNSTVAWNVWRLGYEFDIVSRDRGYFGLILETKLTEVGTELEDSINSEFSKTRAPIPAIGAIARVYVSRFTPITAEVTAFQIPDNLVNNYRLNLIDFDIYTTVNLTEKLGISIGYRSMDMSYLFERDSGHFIVKGLYLSGALRF